MTATPNHSNQNDFDTKDLVRIVSDQNKDIQGLSSRIKALEDKFGTHECIADTLCVTVEKAAKMQSMLSEAFIKQLKSDDRIKNAVLDLVDKADRKYLVLALKRFGLWIYGLLMLVVGLLIQAAIAHFTGQGQ